MIAQKIISNVKLIQNYRLKYFQKQTINILIKMQDALRDMMLNAQQKVDQTRQKQRKELMRLKVIMAGLSELRAKKRIMSGDASQSHSNEPQAILTGHEKLYLQQLRKFKNLKWMVSMDKFATGDCFGGLHDVNDTESKKEESMVATQLTGLIKLEHEHYLRLIEKAKDKRMIDKTKFLRQIPIL